MKITRIKADKVEFMKQRKEVRAIINELNSLADDEAGVLVDFDSQNEQASVVASLRHYDPSISTKKFVYGDPEDQRYILYYKDHVKTDMAGSES